MVDRPERGNERDDFPGRQDRGRPDVPPGQRDEPPGRRTPEEEPVTPPEEGDEEE